MVLSYAILILMTFLTSLSVFVTNDKDIFSYALEIPEVQTNDESSESSNPASTNISQTRNAEEFALKATLDEQNSIIDNFKMYDVEGFGLNLSPNSTLCPTNNCEFELDDGKLTSIQAGQYSLGGVLKIGVEEEEGTRSNVMNIGGMLNVKETLEKDDVTTEFLTGKFNLGEAITVSFSPEISYRVTNGTLAIDDDEAMLILQGERTK